MQKGDSAAGKAEKPSSRVLLLLGMLLVSFVEHNEGFSVLRMRQRERWAKENSSEELLVFFDEINTTQMGLFFLPVLQFFLLSFPPSIIL